MKKPGYLTDFSTIGRQVKDSKVTGDDIDEFDVIIVGGGTAGCVLASRLSEVASIRVLLLESGGSGKSLLFSRVPSAFSLLFHSKHAYALYTEPQTFARGKKKFWPRGKMLGGCSSINAQMAQYGFPGDFDEWSRIVDDESWSWKNISSYFKRFESYSHDSEQPNVDISLKGSQGPVRVGYFSDISEASKKFITTCVRLGVPFSTDFNTPAGSQGVNRIMTYIDENRQRVSSESAYLTEEVLARPNLRVVLHSQVTKVLIEKANGETRAIGVEFAKDKRGALHRALATKEIIISAGAVHSPQLLLLSGVGPAEHLKEHGIPVLHDLPGVGSNLVDHPVVDTYFKDKSKSAPKHLKPHNIWDLIQFIGALIRYLITRRGSLATNWGESAAFIRSDDPCFFPPNEYPDELQDSTSGGNGPDLEIFTTALAYTEHGSKTFNFHAFAVHACLIRPLSVGNICLRSSDPWDTPLINPKYLKSPDDLKKLVRGLKLCLKIARTEPLSLMIDQHCQDPRMDHMLHLKTDQELEEVVRERVETLYHPTSTCRMASLQDGGVVDSKLRVHGIRGLRVCDASVFPSIVSGHTAGATFAVAEKLSDIMKDYLSNSIPKR